MKILRKCFKTWDQLAEHLRSHIPSIYSSSQTSMVIPFERIEKYLKTISKKDIMLCDLSQLPSQFELIEHDRLRVRGPFSWKEATSFVRSKGRNIKTAPTEELALICAGLATSATGERCFGYGNLRSQVHRVKYFDFNGEEQTLDVANEFPKCEALESYQSAFTPYKDFKNAPYPRFQQETDLMIGTEGQLGVISEVIIETAPLFQVNYMFLLLPKWEVDANPHIEILNMIQPHRSSILSCELVDSNCWEYLPEEDRLGNENDVLFFEIIGDKFDNIFNEIFEKLKLTSIENIYEISEERFHQIRAAVPRSIFEANAKMGVVKHGTDVQVRIDQFSKLLDFYRDGMKLGIKYNLFGHFGDAHLHYNLMPSPDMSVKCLEYFDSLYSQVIEWGGSPFAEHGIGLIKRKFIGNFHSEVQTKLFKQLKKKHDPHLQFFPGGFMDVTNAR